MDGCGDRPADGVAGGRARRAGTLSLQHIKAILMLTNDTVNRERNMHDTTVQDF